MSYAILWIETLLTAVLWTAMLSACLSRVRLKSVAVLGSILATLIPLLLFGGLAAGAGFLKYGFHLEHSWFVYFLALLIAYCIGRIVLLRVGHRPVAMSRARSASTWPRARLAIGFLAAASVTSMTLWNMDMEVRAHAESLRTEAGAMMLSVSPPNVSDSQNGAIWYEKAFVRLRDDNTLRGPESPLYDQVPNESHAATPDILKRHELTIKLLHRGAAMPDARFDHDYAHPRYTMLLPELTPMFRAVDLLWLHARFEQARGNVASAMIDVNAMFQLSKAIGGEPIQISALSSAGQDRKGVHALEDLLPAVSRKEQLDGLDIGDGPFTARMMARDLDGEEAFGLTAFSDIANGQMDFSMLMGVTNSNHFKRDASITDHPPISVLMRVFLLPDDLASFRELLDGYRGLAMQPYDKTRSETESEAMTKHSGLVTGAIVPAMPSILRASALARATHAGARAGIAMTRYRLDRGNYPASLGSLVPDYLDEIPLDPFDGQPMRLVHRGDQWIVYSIGPDAKDDGGAAYEPVTKTGDVPFVLKIGK